MKWWYSTFLILFFIPRLAHAAVSISEIAWMGTAESSYCEWIELYNDGDAVSLAGWELDESNGATKIISLSKTIPAHGYLLIERTTASCPDPVPSITGESGSFGGSGLSNDGEDIVLKDSSGTAVEHLSYASGWPAGDAQTKETMQWSGSSWVSATASPGSGYAGSKNSDDDTQSDTHTGKSEQKKLPTYTPHIDLAVPTNVYAGATAEYDATVTIEHGKTTAGYYIWNFGDGSAIHEIGLHTQQHMYRYAGTYALTLSYYASTAILPDEKPDLQILKTIAVSQPDLIVTDKGNGWIEIKNTLASPMDVSGWNINADEYSATLPEFSFIAANATLSMSLEQLSLPQHPQKLSITTPSGIIAASAGVNTVASLSVVIPKVSSHPSFAAAVKPVTSIVVAQTDNSDDSADTAPAVQLQKTGKKKNAMTIVYGAALITIIGLFVLLERAMAKRE